MKKIILLISIISITFLISKCSDLDDSIEKANLSDVISRDSKLFNLLQKVSNNSSNPPQATACIDFIYPLRLFIYNQNLEKIDEISIIGDLAFSEFLTDFPNDQFLSISLPLQTTLADGTIFQVNSYEELKIAIDSCDKEDIILYANGVFSFQADSEACVWTVPFNENNFNPYSGSLYKVENNNIAYYHLNTQTIGVWSFLFINDEFFLNINLEGNSEITQYWNKNFKVDYLSDNKIILNDTNNNLITLERKCRSQINYEVGDEGPTGGIIAYKKNTFSNGWKYIELNQENLIIEEWGCLNSNIINAQFTSIGSGLQNTIQIANYHQNLNNYYTNPAICNILNNGTVSSRTALGLSINQKKDWHIPSAEEWEKIYINLQPLNVIDFNNDVYWTSSESSATSVFCYDTNQEDIISLDKNQNNVKTKAIRYF